MAVWRMRGLRRAAMLAVGAVAFASLAGCGQDDADADSRHTIAFLRATVSPEPQNQETLLETLAEEGFERGRNLEVLADDPREIHPDPADAAAQAEEWVGAGADLIVALSTAGARAAMTAVPQTNVLFISNDPTATGLVEDEQRPEGNATGVTFRVPADRLLDLGREALPRLRRLAILTPADDPAAAASRDAAVDAAQTLGITAVVATFAGPDSVDDAIAQVEAADVDAVLLTNSPLTVAAVGALEPALAAARLPVLATTTAATGALLVLDPDTTVLYRQLGRQAARLLSGTPPAQVPVEDPGAFRVTLNRDVARRLGVELPDDLVERADTVIG